MDLLLHEILSLLFVGAYLTNKNTIHIVSHKELQPITELDNLSSLFLCIHLTSYYTCPQLL